MEDHSSVISIKGEDIIENMDNILEKSDVFEINTNIDYIKCFLFYCDGNKLVNFKKTELNVYENKITKKELLALILKNNKLQSKKYDLTGIYKYELNLEDKEIKNFCKSPQDYSFLTQYQNVEDIHFSPCIEILNDNNTLILLFSRMSKNKKEDSNKENKENKKNKTQKKVKFDLKKETNNKTMKTIHHEQPSEISE